MRRSYCVGFGVVIIIVVFSVFYYGLFYPIAVQQKVWVEIKKGTPFQKVLETLSEKGLINEKFSIFVYAKLTRADRNIKHGIYLFSGTLTPYKVLKTLIQGRVYLKQVTIPEGYNIWQIAALLDREGIVDATSFLQTATDKTLLKKLHINGPSVEGYLFPDTYKFPLKSSARMVIEKMVNNLKAHLTEEILQRASEIGMSIHQLLTLASLIEKEAKVPEEKPLISAVFHNRLRRRMPLASDPTTIYGIKPLAEGVTKADLKRRHPYNTYLRTGLPPGPICSVGIDSIKAALYPAAVDYLYFVAKGDGTHYFSRTLKEQLRAIRELKRKKQKRIN